MIIIEVKGSIEKSLKIAKQLRDRKHFKKKSVERRDEVKKAIYVQKKFNTEE